MMTAAAVLESEVAQQKQASSDRKRIVTALDGLGRARVFWSMFMGEVPVMCVCTVEQWLPDVF